MDERIRQQLRHLLTVGLSLLTAHAVAQGPVPDRGSAQVTGLSAFARASRSGAGPDGGFCIRVMYNDVPLPLYGEIFIGGNAIRCDSADDVAVETIELRFRYRGEAVRTKTCSTNHLCFFTERFFRSTKTLECAAVIATSGGWSASAATAPECL